MERGLNVAIIADTPKVMTEGSSIDAFGIQYEGKTGLSKAEFSWAA